MTNTKPRVNPAPKPKVKVIHKTVPELIGAHGQLKELEKRRRSLAKEISEINLTIKQIWDDIISVDVQDDEG